LPLDKAVVADILQGCYCQGQMWQKSDIPAFPFAQKCYEMLTIAANFFKVATEI
jgi:hypothetical protein